MGSSSRGQLALVCGESEAILLSSGNHVLMHRECHRGNVETGGNPAVVGGRLVALVCFGQKFTNAVALDGVQLEVFGKGDRVAVQQNAHQRQHDDTPC